MPYGGLLGSDRTRRQGSRGYMRYQALECAREAWKDKRQRRAHGKALRGLQNVHFRFKRVDLKNALRRMHLGEGTLENAPGECTEGKMNLLERRPEKKSIKGHWGQEKA